MARRVEGEYPNDSGKWTKWYGEIEDNYKWSILIDHKRRGIFCNVMGNPIHDVLDFADALKEAHDLREELTKNANN
jgi:O-acetylhomoserine/O-acetylserine sulfhydrylase-like pyridoxal-dependent enzyme